MPARNDSPAPESEHEASLNGEEQVAQDAPNEPVDILEEPQHEQQEPEPQAEPELEPAPEHEPEANTATEADANAEADVEVAQDVLNPPATRLYTESEIGSPSIHATPDMPVRHGSFSFASLPPREMLQSVRQQSLGLDSDATEDEPFYVRAPELEAHEERMRAYEELSPQYNVVVAEPQPEVVNFDPPSPITGPSTRLTRSMTQRELEAHEEQRINELQRSLTVSDDEPPTHDTTITPPTVPTIPEQEEHEQVADTVMQEERHEQVVDAVMQEEEHEQVVDTAMQDEEQVQAQGISDEQATINVSHEQSEEVSQDDQSAEEPAQESTQQAINATTTQGNAAERSRLRAPRNLGRPVRPTAAGTTIRITSVARQRPVNTAPVAAHNNQEARRVRPQPPTQPIASAPRQPLPTPKVFATAQKKKEQDQRAAERAAAVKKQQKERRDAKHEELRTKKRGEQEAADQEARRKSNEFAEKHIQKLDENPAWRAHLETRQEREEGKVAEQKRENREKIINRQNALQGRVYGSSSIRPLTAIDLNQPARPASRLEMHQHEPESNNETTPTENAPPRSVHNQVTRASTRPTAPPQRPGQRPSQQQEGTLPPYPTSLSRAPLRGSTLQRPGSIFQNTTQSASSTINAFPAPPPRGPDMRQYATQRPPMANDMPSQQTRALPTQNQPLPPQPQVQQVQPQQAHPAQQVASSATRPQPSQPRVRLIQAINESSPIPSNISLPEIHTDSSDDSDRQSLPSWASPGHVFQTLSTQETYDTDRIFGPIKRVAIDDVFGTMPAEKRKRLNLRTSSANWVRTGDALTQIEVIEDRAGREAIKNAGGWIYGISDYHNHEVRSYNNGNNNRNMN